MEKWTKGKIGRTVITDSIEGLSEGSERFGIDACQYYGGVVVCENIYNKKNVSLISASPDLLEACKIARAIFHSQGIDSKHLIVGEMYQKIEDAIQKATDIS